MIDTGDGPVAVGDRDDPPELVRAGLLRDLAAAWSMGSDPRYRDAGRALAQRLVNDVTRASDRTVFADRDAYVIGSVLELGATLEDGGMIDRGQAALDSLLRRVYAQRRPVRHVAGPGSPARALLQDQVQVASACLAAHRATGAPRYLAVAQDLAPVLQRDFADSGAAGYFDPRGHGAAAAALAERAKPVLDDLMPGANAAAARVLLRLPRATREPQQP